MALRTVSLWANTTPSPVFPVLELTLKSKSQKGQLSPIGSLVPYPAPHSSRASRAGTPSPPRAAAEQNWGAPVPCREHQYRGNTVIPTPWWRLQCQQNLPQSLFLPAASQPPGRCSRNVAGKAVSIHSPEALLASPSPAKRMRAHTQIIFNLCFNIACKCTAEC